MLDDLTFRRDASGTLEALRKALICAETEAEFEVEEQNGALHITFDEPPSEFVLTPNLPVRQIWISTPSTNLKLDWDDVSHTFVLPQTGESLHPLVARLVNDHLGSGDILLG